MPRLRLPGGRVVEHSPSRPADPADVNLALSYLCQLGDHADCGGITYRRGRRAICVCVCHRGES